MVNLTTAGFDKEYMLSVDPAMANYRGRCRWLGRRTNEILSRFAGYQELA